MTCDIPVAFLQSNWLEDNPCLKQYKTCTKSYRELMYGKLNKAVYGTLSGAILFYEKLVIQLLQWDFEMNPYDQCTFNNMIDGNQLIINFHIDDLHVSSEHKQDIKNFLFDLNEAFKTDFKELTIYQDKLHDYLGINIDYSWKDYVNSLCTIVLRIY